MREASMLHKKNRLWIALIIFFMSAECASAQSLTDMLDFIWGLFESALETLVKTYINVMLMLFTWNPDITLVESLIESFIRMLTPLYVIALLITGLYFFFYSESAQGRAKARSAFFKILISMFLVIASKTIYQFLLDFSTLLVNFFMGIVKIDVTGLAIIIIALPRLVFWLIVIQFVVLIIVYVLRYVLLLIFGAVFPIIIFLYMFDYTKEYGRKFLQLTIALIFTPVTQAIVFAVFMTALSNLNPSINVGVLLAQMCILLGGFILLIISPLITMGLMEWVGGLICAWGFQQMANHMQTRATAAFLVGGLLMGEGAGAIPLAATMYMIGQLEKGTAEHGPDLVGSGGGHGSPYRVWGRAKWCDRSVGMPDMDAGYQSISAQAGSSMTSIPSGIGIGKTEPIDVIPESSSTERWYKSESIDNIDTDTETRTKKILDEATKKLNTAKRLSAAGDRRANSAYNEAIKSYGAFLSSQHISSILAEFRNIKDGRNLTSEQRSMLLEAAKAYGGIGDAYRGLGQRYSDYAIENYQKAQDLLKLVYYDNPNKADILVYDLKIADVQMRRG